MRSACALAVGGLDPGGGAGVLADVRSFVAAGVFGCAAVALVTVQSTDGLVAHRALDARLVVEQIEEVVRAQRVRAIKVGALGSLANVRALAAWLGRYPRLPVVLDPVMVPTRGRKPLLASRALSAMRDALLPRATLITANAPEAAALTGLAVTNVAGATIAARALVAQGARAALVKGGHLVEERDVVDVLATRGGVLALRGKRLAVSPIHGGGCVLASLIAGRLAWMNARGTAGEVEAAVRWARRMHRRALANPVDVGGAMRVVVA